MKKTILSVLAFGGAVSLLTALAVAIARRHIAVISGAALLAATTSPAQTLINGAGSTFDYPAFTKWFEVYGRDHSDVRFNYQSIGSGGGQKQLLNQTVDFGASDAPMKDEAMSQAPGKILQLPIVAGGVAIMYNLPGNPRLRLDGDTLANIYLGNITTWNDPKITALNPGVSLPNLAIVPLHRAEGSGTTFIFTDFLSAVSPAWSKQVGKGVSVKWPAGVGLGAKGSEGVAGQIQQIPGAIGYGELAYADESKIPYADIKNSSGNFVSPAPASVSAALAEAKIPDDFRFSMVNAPGADSYPIAGPSWVLIYQTQNDPVLGQKLVDFLKWAITDGQKISSTLDYAPLPDAVQQRELKLLTTVKY
ncbi:MAG TPA: phosphate ABC transporter substrate-binding protein PstS [Verrucomicrobiae bacterium]|nr:phosphate ABC transporter substrate-binding protein PstS [Verrucomicrobiae bacterium]